uniref:Replicase n=1 Tax=Shelduck rhabdovirus TaxID=2212784 RepID=A0A3G1RPI1_9RHAB|nr:MAG: RNA-dependent RNA polymerase [Shelduck rhabdovirus]
MDECEYDEFRDQLEDNLLDEEVEFLGTRGKVPARLNNADFNLDSPLLSDECEALISKLQGKYASPLFESNAWKPVLKIKNQLKIQDLSVLDFYPWVGRFASAYVSDTSGAARLLKEANTSASKTWKVPKTFLNLLNNVEIANEDHGSTGVVTHLLQKYIDIMFVLITMNERLTPPTDADNYATCHSEKLEEGSLRVTSKCFGEILLTDRYWIIERRVICNRNYLLMVKDLLSARMHTIISMENRWDNKFSKASIGKFCQLYALGDQILYCMGNDGYRVLKYLEPFCILRLSELARKYRDLIPIMPRFRNYLEDEIRQFGPGTQHLRRLFDSIQDLDDVHLVLQIFGSYRHWGHPTVDYLGGLESLYQQVTQVKKIDDELAQLLASDLAKIVLKSHFRKTKEWAVDSSILPINHPFYHLVENKIWPTPAEEAKFGDKWHTLPLKRCFEIPDFLDPAVIYSDKAHSIQKTELLNHLRRSPNKRIPTKRVLSSFLDNHARNWPEFLKRVDEQGLSDDSLIIGLRAKERELKTQGRFFALMSWELREYFVVTEYLIKEHFVPLFKGLTMADDLTGVMKKLLSSTSGHGHDDYTSLTVSNHLDYSKWNNHQRKESNKYVFEVMGKFLGYPNLISRTHEFFEKSLIYFCNRPDLMAVQGTVVTNKPGFRVCWNGQAGGLEGLRQKGWSILNLLLILRIQKARNTEIKVLAQGDNQVLNMHYKIPQGRDEAETRTFLQEVINNNESIMRDVETWTYRLGLIINKDETVQSCDFLVYGKVPIFRGNLLLPESKRWSRINCVSNDQIPSLGSILGTVGSTALGVSHFSSNYIDPLIKYNFFINLSRVLLEWWNPLLGRSVLEVFPNTDLKQLSYLLKVAFLDPSLGGVCGVNPSRFLIRGFPDPVTESLSFWKYIHAALPLEYQRAISTICHPQVKSFQITDLPRLLENPQTLNLPSATSAQIAIRNEIRGILGKKIHSIKNEVIKSAIVSLKTSEEHLLKFLQSIRPRFPRFLSEFRSSTFLGVCLSLVNLYENSRTIRTQFLKETTKDLSEVIIKSEVRNIKTLTAPPLTTVTALWRCSSEEADRLRFITWGGPVVGATIPHPLELLTAPKNSTDPCCECRLGKNDYVTTIVSSSCLSDISRRGPFTPYLGSKTSESTSIFSPWEKEVTVPLLIRADRMRRCINWFVKADSVLGSSIFNNIKSLTGQDLSTYSVGFMRTGSALHRFSTARQSSGGYSGISPAPLSRMVSTTDTLSDLGITNYDFMFQSLILFCQVSITGLDPKRITPSMHNHIKCHSCVREIKDVVLESEIRYNPPDVTGHTLKWIPGPELAVKLSPMINFLDGNWERVSQSEGSFHVGRVVGYLCGELLFAKKLEAEGGSLLPLGIKNKLSPAEFFSGFVEGCLQASAVDSIHRRFHALQSKPTESLVGTAMFVINKLTKNTVFLSFIGSGSLFNYVISSTHRVPPSYPSSPLHIGQIVYSFLLRLLIQRTKRAALPPVSRKLWLFSDILSPNLSGPFILSRRITQLLLKPRITKQDLDEIRELKAIEISCRGSTDGITLRFPGKYIGGVTTSRSEVRHAVAAYPSLAETPSVTVNFGEEINGHVESESVEFILCPPEDIKCKRVPRILNPLISGLRTFQMATGSHYKLRCILNHYQTTYRDFLCGGDGSGGLTAYLLRRNPSSRGLFNSLLNLGGINLRGAKPGPPSAVTALGESSTRCLNIATCWRDPSDLNDKHTWETLFQYKMKYRMLIDLIVLDFEENKPGNTIIEENILTTGLKILEPRGSIIYKTYCHRIADNSLTDFLTRCGRLFKNINLCQTDFTSSHSSEIYIYLDNYMADSIGQRYPNIPKLKQFIENRFCFRTAEEELNRAQKVRKLNRLRGVPMSLVPDLLSELIQWLDMAGTYAGQSNSLAHLILHTKYLPRTLTRVILSVVGNCVFRFVFPAKRSSPPSDPKLENFMSLWASLHLWESLVNDDATKHQQTLNIINSDCPVSFYLREEGEHLYPCVEVGRKINLVKRVRLLGKGAAMGQGIRLLDRLSNYPKTTIPTGRELSQFHGRLSSATLDKHSNLSLVPGKIDRMPDPTKHRILVERAEPEGGWRE